MGNEPSAGIAPPAQGSPDVDAMRHRIAARLFDTAMMVVRIGRFEVVEQLGAGGMGVVYRAWDPELGRQVALKLLHPGVVGDEGERSRLQREAQALAKLSHPNVVSLYEVGRHENALFLAMELVEGESLQRWQWDGGHDWREIIDVYLQAGEGLAAAHAKGLVHRDFKPANVIVGRDGRVRVADFGLARGSGLRSEASEERGGSSLGLGDATLTKTGAVVGTPAYMSPEQRRREPVDARSDQYSFCVSLWETAFGERPPTTTTQDTGDAARSQVSARGARLPRAVQRRLLPVLHRGLRPQPDERWSDMMALLLALRRARDHARWRSPVGLAGVGIVATSAWLWAAPPVAHPICAELEASAPTWGQAQARVIETGTAGLGLGESAPVLATTVGTAVAEHVRTWHASASLTCTRATKGEAVEPQSACLARLARDLEVMVDVLTTHPRALLEAHEVLAQLTPTRVCEHTPEIVASDADAADGRADRRIVEARVLTAAGLYDDALRTYDALAADVAFDDVSKLSAAIELGRGRVYLERGDPLEAHVHHERAVTLGLATGSAGVTALSQAGLARVRAELLDEHNVARWAARQCLAQATGAALGLVRAECWRSMAATYPGYDSALPAVWLLRVARLAKAGLLGEDHPDLGGLELAIANVHADAGDDVRAHAIYVRERARRVAAYGSRHPGVLAIDYDLALLDHGRGRHKDAEHRMRGVVAGLEAAYGRGSVNLSGPLVLSAWIAQALQHPDQALEHAKAAAKIQEQLPPGHRAWGSGLVVGASIALAKPDLREALGLYEQLATHGPKGERTIAWSNVAWLRCAVDRCVGASDAIDHIEWGGLEEGEEGTRLAVEVIRANIALADGEIAAARHFARRVLARVEGDADMSAYEAEARWAMARATLAETGDVDGARLEAAQAVKAAAGDPTTLAVLRASEPRLFEAVAE